MNITDRLTAFVRVSLVLSLAAGCAPQEASVGSPQDETELASDVQSALYRFPGAEVLSIGRRGVPTHVRGKLGVAATDDVTAALADLAPVFRLRASDLELAVVKTDDLLTKHYRMRQLHDGLEVVGGELIVHTDKEGAIYAVSGGARGETAPSSTPAITAQQAVDAVMVDGATTTMPLLSYYLADDGAMHLVWDVTVSSLDGDTPVKERCFVDAHGGTVVGRHGLIHTALTRKVYTSRNSASTPGTLLRTEGSAASGDTAADTNYTLLGKTYDCYKTGFGRDSFNGSGGTFVSSVHYSRNYGNAFWDGSQMVYGDGDGQYLGQTAISYDITAHELTHGVTQYESNLRYQSESGALNEALSDIFAAYCQAKDSGSVSAATWKLAEDVWTPTQSGDALRYMANPTQDGQSKDYYPTRYTGTQDYGGVHLNSGIANLAFQLLVDGGRHPRGVTTNTVPGIGIVKAGAIFYRAQTQYLTSTSNFQAARAATAQAATELYGATEATAVHAAWTAVGVPGAPSGGGTGGGTGGGGGTDGGSTTPSGGLTNGQTVSGLSGGTGSETRFTFAVPSTATRISFKLLGGGTGDADLYVRYGAPPTTQIWDGRSWNDGNTESLTGNATAGTWYILIYGYRAYTGVSLQVSYQ